MSSVVPSNKAPISAVLVTLASFIVIVAGLIAAKAIVVQFLLAAFLAVISWPSYYWLRQRKLPTWAAMIVLIVGYVVIGFGVAAVVGSSINSFVESMPIYQLRLEKIQGEFTTFLQGHGIKVSQEMLKDFLDVGALMKLAGNTLSELGKVLADAFIIILTTIFILFEVSSFRGKLLAISKDEESSEDSMELFSTSMKQYIVIKTWLSLMTAALVIVWLMFLGVDFPLLWGLIAFLFNFIPNLGSIIAAFPAVILALVQLGVQSAVLTAAGYVAVNMVVGNVIEPKFMGKGLGLSTLVVFLSLVFWGWALGPIGMLLSVPLTMTVKIALESREDTRWIGVLLGPEGEAHEQEELARENDEEAEDSAD